MKAVTQIEPIQGGRGRARVYLDGAFAFVLYKKELAEYHITEDATLSEEAYREITEVLLPKRAKLRAMHLLEQRPYTEQGLRDKLSDGDYPVSCIDEAIAYVISYGYIDDLRYAVDHITLHLADRNRRRLETDLLKKGIDKQTIEAAWEEVAAQGTDAEDRAAYERAMIVKELRKKHFDPETADYDIFAKTAAALARKGFDPSLIRDVMQSYEI